jgi:hypothetical protein
MKPINQILEVLNKGTISTNNYTSSDKPLFMKNSAESFKQYNNLKLQIPENVNRNVKLIYEIFGNEQKEIYLDEWTIMSLEEALKRYNELCTQGQDNVFDIGFRYLGMGHIEMISCDLKSHLLFYRPDGGSNDWDRITNVNELIQKGSTPYNKFHFYKWFYNIYK